MENKYYTPELEEFHIGFEYEALVDYYGQEFGTFTVEDTHDLRSICTTWDRGEVEHLRVKYLDREDIESLGFKWSDSVEYSYEVFIDYKSPRVPTQYTMIFNWGVQSPWISIKANSTTLFAGHVKNKSELKKVLKMIGYEQG